MPTLYVIEVRVENGDVVTWVPMLELPQGIAVSDDEARAQKVRANVNQSLAFRRKVRVARYERVEEVKPEEK